jgi:filamentous hemagglutinin family protein
VIQRKISNRWSLKLLSPLAIAGTIAISEHPACAQVTPDNTLGVEQSIVNSSTSNGSLRQQIEGGAIRGTNLFHSFRDFNIAKGQSLYFQNPIGIRNIISRVTGGSPSNIEGTLGVSGGTANLFLLNPNGIIFGANARLDVRGSFVATTATAIQFGTQGFFSSAASDSPPLLTVNPSAFLFNQVARASIVNRSTAPLDSGRQGLQVPDGHSLLLLGGDVNLAGGGVNAAGGRVELGAVAGTGIVGLSLDGNNLRLSFPATLDRANIALTNGATVNTSGEGGGPIQIWGRRILINGGSQVAAFTQGVQPGSSLTVSASEFLEVIGIAPFGNVSTLSFGDGKSGDLTIETRRLRIRDGAQILSGTLGNGSAGQLNVNASESVEVGGRGNSPDSFSGLASFTGNVGQAGNLTVHTKRLIVRDGGVISTASLIASEEGQFFPVSGEGGNLTINASSSVELSRKGFILTETSSPGNAGNIAINTDRLLVQDGSKVSALSAASGNAGNIAVRARSIELKNQSQIAAETTASQGGNITLQVQALLLLRRDSSISTTAGTAQGGGDGGNITFNGNFIVAVATENSDIAANAFTGRGGSIEINAQSLFGIQFRPQLTPLSDITASSEFGVAGVVTINTPDVDPSRGLLQLPVDLSDASRLIVQTCPTGDTIAKPPNEFIITGRGGLPPTPREAINRDAIQVDLVTANTEDVPSVSHHAPDQNSPPPSPAPIVEAQGWQVAADGTLYLVAAVPTHPMVPWLDRPIHCR